MPRNIPRTAEHVSEGHPDKFCDQVGDRILDAVLALAASEPAILESTRTAIECLAKDNLLWVSGEAKMPPEMRARLNIIDLARDVWKRIGYGTNVEDLTVIDHVRTQSPDIAQGGGSGVDTGTAGDQGIMVGYATNETPEMMPREWVLARDICLRLTDLRRDGTLPWLRSDCKSQVTLDAQGHPFSAVVAAHHADSVSIEQLREEIRTRVIRPILGDELDAKRITINGTGRFTVGGPTGDAGVVGRKIVVDAYGPRISVGGGAYSGKDPTKVDRSAAYMARHIAKTIVMEKIANASECTVTLAYAIGCFQPEMITAVTDRDEDLSAWVRNRFPDLSPCHIIERLHLRRPKGWSYSETAAYGHYGRSMFPWESVGA